MNRVAVARCGVIVKGLIGRDPMVESRRGVSGRVVGFEVQVYGELVP